MARRRYSPRSLFWLLAPVVIAVAAAVVYVGRGRTAAADSLAILPFAIGGGDPGIEAIALGIRETVTDTLSRLPHLRVIAAGSVSRVEPERAEPRQIGRELGVRAVVTGRIAQRGDTLAVDAELVSVAGGARLWGGSFIRPFSDILVVQEDLATEIAQRLRPRLSAAERQVLRTRSTGDAAAYQLFLKGRFHRTERTAQGLDDAIAFFKQAIAEDPAYALAWAFLAECYASLGGADYAALSPREALQQARAAAARALELEPELAEAHAALGLVGWTFERDRNAAERSLLRAIELRPGYAPAHQWYGEMLAALGRAREGEREIRRALDLDPLSPELNADLGLLAYYARDWDGAIARYRAALALTPSFVPARVGLALGYAQKRLFDDAFRELAEAARSAPSEPGLLAVRGYVLGRSGRVAEARAVAEELRRLSAQRFVQACDVAAVFAGAGDTDAAFTWLGRACEQRCPRLAALEVDPAFDPLRADPRFAELQRCLGGGPAL